jgi:hypothetical protein
MFKKLNNSILTLQQVEFLVNLKLNWWGIMTTSQWKIYRKDSHLFCQLIEMQGIEVNMIKI